MNNSHLPGVNVRTHHGKHVALALARVERVSGHPPQHRSRVLPNVLVVTVYAAPFFTNDALKDKYTVVRIIGG